MLSYKAGTTQTSIGRGHGASFTGSPSVLDVAQRDIFPSRRRPAIRLLFAYRKTETRKILEKIWEIGEEFYRRSVISSHKIKKAEPIDSAFLFRGKNHGYIDPLYRVYFINFLLTPANPISPSPRSSMVAGSGTGVVPVENSVTNP